MKNSRFLPVLEELGLTENEAQVYLTALSLGPTTVLSITRASGIRRTTIYTVIESLKAKGLMSIELAGLKQRYVAEDPDKLESMLEARRAKFRKLLPELEAMHNLKGGESTVKYYQGLEAVKNIDEGLIRDIKPHETYNVIADQEKWLGLDDKFFKDFTARRGKLNIDIRIIFQDTPIAREFKKYERNYNAKIKLMPRDIKLDIDIITTPQRIVFHQLIPPIMAIVVENQSLIRAHQQIFDIMWSSLPDKDKV